MYTVTYYQSATIAFSRDFDTMHDANRYFSGIRARIRHGAAFLMDNVRHELIRKVDTMDYVL